MVLAAVSGGPDSMALLAWLENSGYSYAIAHVNYHKRPSAARDEAIVRQWALEHKAPLWILHPQKENAENFQAWAREVRYAFFQAAAKAHGLDTVALGHQQDDAIETWMMQKARQSLPDVYGLQTHGQYGSLHLWRPLLDQSKAQLQAYCEASGIVYGLDESNRSDAYLRNRIRHSLIEPADSAQRNVWLQELEQDNSALQARKAHAQSLASLRDAKAIFADRDGWLALDFVIHEKTGRHMARKALEDLKEKLAGGSMQTVYGWNVQVLDADGKKTIEMRRTGFVPFYIESLERLQALAQAGLCYGPFRLDKTGKTIESFRADPQDFPLIIRPAREGDAIAMRFGTKKIGRLFIDRKIPALFRPFYPVIEGKKGILFASLAGCDKDHYSKMENCRFYMVNFRV